MRTGCQTGSCSNAATGDSRVVTGSCLPSSGCRTIQGPINKLSISIAGLWPAFLSAIKIEAISVNRRNCLQARQGWRTHSGEFRISQTIEGVTDLGFRLVRVRRSGASCGRSQLQITAEPVVEREMTVEIANAEPACCRASMSRIRFRCPYCQPAPDRPAADPIEDWRSYSGEPAKIALRFCLMAASFDQRLAG